MTWVRRDDQASIHRKVAPLDDATYRLWSEAIEWCSRNGTDGRIAPDELGEIKRGTRPRAAKLVERGLWHAAGYLCGSEKCPQWGETGWVIHDYLDYNPSKEQVQLERAAKAERTRKWREARNGGDVSRDASQAEHETGTRRARVPSPSRPVPPRPEGGGGGAPDAPPAADGGVAAAGGEREDRKPTPAHLGAEDPAVIEADRRRLEALAAHQESLNLEAEERARRGAAAVRAALPPSRVKPQARRPAAVFVEAVDNPHYDPAATLNGGAA